MTHTDRINSYLAAGRTVSGGKGDQLVQQNEQAQLDLNKQLAASFSQNNAMNKQTLDYLNGKLKPMIENPTGFSPEALTALRTSTSDTNAGQFNDATSALNDQLAARGGASSLPSGVDAQLRAQVASVGATQEASSQNGITLQNEQLKQQNLWNAINALSGNATAYNPTGFANSATSGAGAVSNLSQALTASKQSQLLGALGGVAAGAGSALGGYLGK